MALSKLADLKKNLIILGAIYAVLLTIAGAGYWLLNNMQEAKERQFDKIQRQVNTQNSKVVELQQKIQEFREAEKLWETLKTKHAIREGLQFDLAKETLNELERKYHFSEPIKIDLSPSIELSDVYQTKDITIVSSNVQIKFSAVTDEFVFRFIEALQVYFPGYINIESFDLRRASSVNDEALNRIYRGELPSLVSAELLFKWQDLKDVQTKDGS